jgi:ATP-dependent Clp protease ATP-binding subunit ClpC
MYERFTDRARKVMQLANQEATRLNHEQLETGHVLLGLVAEGHGVAANVLASLNIDLRKLRHEVEKILRYGPSDTYPCGPFPHTPSTEWAIKYAHEEAKRLGHKYVGTEHLLLGLLRQEEGIAGQVLINLGLTLADVRGRVLRLLEGVPEDLPTSPMTTVNPDIAQEQTPASATPPYPIVEGHLDIIRALIERLNVQKEEAVIAEDFPRAAHYRDEADALKRILAWYEWFRRQQ